LEYGFDHTSLKYQFDSFYIFDFSENIGDDRTELFVDHHLRQGESKAKVEIIEKSPSCVSLMRKHSLCVIDSLTEEYFNSIDALDSSDYIWSGSFTKEDLLLPEPKDVLSKFVILNQLLRKNRKHGLAEKLLSNGATNVDANLYFIEKDKGIKTVRYNTYSSNKQRLIEKIQRNKDKYIKVISNIPILFTKDFTQEDWKGYDLNILGYLEQSSPFLIVVFDMSGNINTQIVRNAFYEGEKKSTIFCLLKDVITEIRGHDNILNISYKTGEEASKQLDIIISKLSAQL
jgi:hypothetical protein